MPKDLAALLAEDGAVAADVLARALERQRETGGALDTALLELGALPEDALVDYLARAAELPPAPASAWSGSDARARRVFPSRVAERHGLAPFALEGRELALVATHPVDVGLLDEISFMLSLHLTAHVAPEWRVRELIHRLYGAAFPPRLAALAAAAARAAAAAADDGGEEAGEPAAPAVAPRTAAPPSPAAAGFARDGSDPLEPLAAALQQALEAADAALFEGPPAEGDEPPGAHDEAEEMEREDEPERPAPDRSAPPRWTLDDAREALAAARDRDEVVLVAIRYARDFFEFAAMFAVTRDAVAGHDALGREDERDRARSVAIWASDPGIVKTVIETRSPYLGPVARDAAGTEAILSGLGRGAPRTVLVYPVLLRDRVVCALYADNGEAPVSPRRLGDLLLFLSGVGAAFERIIRARKKRRSRRARPVDGGGAGAAARPAEAGGDAEAGAAEAANAVAAAGGGPGIPAEVDAGATTPENAAAGEPVSAEAPEREAEEPASTGAQPEREEEEAFAFGRGPGTDADGGPDRTPGEEASGEGAAGVEAGSAADAEAEGAGPGESAIEAAIAAIDVDVDVDVDLGDASATAPEEGTPPATSDGDAPPLEEALFAAARRDAARHAPPERAAVPEEAPSGEPAPEVGGPAPAAAEVAAPDVAPAEPSRTPPPEPTSPTALADLALDADEAAAAAARSALAEHRRDPGVRQANERLRRALLSGISLRSRRAALALGAVRDVEAIPLLIQVLETEPETAAVAADALAAITLQRLGPDARRWLAWWKENRGRGRAEWLFSGLTSGDRETRVAAAEELAHAAPPPVAYSADLPPSEREQLARAWAGWWARSGHVL